ncbi:YbhB/YbcL family Raf kinase inhibitor-like protein [Actinacidiphila sp. DG2A-62]|uniref:YbhB/YbcL family Raf kinase inhibitor-like protein n=1 Tax=Actinacidiphila sp. DG2A-62 TaxID=3108821 RepID=UPI002DBF83B0|nr:YbhB/YbcL family Raf kinase inhibitor-like protein [Actinacidiphila sp. DG2A-62]MEC3992566.1 YbhB/YbcL family Raf kinase inhibitor-like protein [Actinacidiphila sp. DG2A-62]
MTLIGRLLTNRRAGEARMAWNLPGLSGPQTLTLDSRDFADGAALPRQHAARAAGGSDTSPHLAWTAPPPGAAELLLVVEDIDVPLPRPVAHCVALLDPALRHLDPGALDAHRPGAGVRLLRSTIGRGYHGPAPIKGHGPHAYVFQLFALAAPVAGAPGAAPPDWPRPRALLAAVTGPVLARGRLTGTYER